MTSLVFSLPATTGDVAPPLPEEQPCPAGSPGERCVGQGPHLVRPARQKELEVAL